MISYIIIYLIYLIIYNIFVNKMYRMTLNIVFYPIRLMYRMCNYTGSYILYDMLGYEKQIVNKYDNDYLDDQYKNNELKNENGFLLV